MSASTINNVTLADVADMLDGAPRITTGSPGEDKSIIQMTDLVARQMALRLRELAGHHEEVTMANLIAFPKTARSLVAGEGGYVELESLRLSIPGVTVLRPSVRIYDGPSAVVKRNYDGDWTISPVSGSGLPVELSFNSVGRIEETVIAAPNRVSFERKVNARLSSGEGWTVKGVHEVDEGIVAVLCRESGAAL